MVVVWLRCKCDPLDFCIGGFRRQSIFRTAHILDAETFGFQIADGDVLGVRRLRVWLAMVVVLGRGSGDVGRFDFGESFDDVHGDL